MDAFSPTKINRILVHDDANDSKKWDQAMTINRSDLPLRSWHSSLVVDERPATKASHGRQRRPKSRLALFVTCCLLAILSPISAVALAPPDFQITDEASYQSFKDTMLKTEYVRNAYLQDPKPRVIGAVAGLVHYATHNPSATHTQLTAFLAEYDARLYAHALGDTDLQRGSHLVSAVRFELPLTGIVGLEGTNTNLGGEIVESLGIDVPPAYAYEENRRRIVRFELARLRALSESPAWANLLGTDKLSLSVPKPLSSAFRRPPCSILQTHWS